MQRSKASWVLMAVLLVGVLAPGNAAAQYGVGQKHLGAHIGMSGTGSSTAAFGLNGEVAYNQNIGIGAWVDTWSYGQSFVGSSWNVRYIALAGTGAWHFAVKSNPKIDPFVGLALGYYVVSTSVDSGTGTFGGSANSTLFLGGFGGARYFFKPNISGVARLGFGATYLTIGVDFKL